ncbi:uncharacterized protein B0H64DRAFT_350567 [Chaetomium fimeti]|uniref:Uncharacterized protein n=1 Tax=Chaetomium fimeti TaxID=1854472 RepID=A0AAE0H5W4_9PEZI|nr:hypothetical protein B0H64DRAFT_350567 [Chaetomium fimeti]
MEGQPKHHLIHLSPYFRPVPAPRGYHGRRLNRHSFLGNLWGLRGHRIPKPPATFMNHPRNMPRATSDAQSTPQRGLGVSDGVPAHQLQSVLDRNFGAFQREFQDMGRGLQRLEKTADDISSELAQGIEKFFERFPPPEPAKHLQERGDAQKTNLQREHRIEIEGLKKKRELDIKRLEEMEKELEMANMRAQIATTELARVQSMMDAELEQIEKQRNAQRDITGAFLNLRKTILVFAGSAAVQLGPLPGTLAAGDTLFHPWSWNHASSSQRKYRVMAKIFHLLFQRILRPGLRIFGVEVFLQSEENPSISDSEAYLRALEQELEAKGVDNTKLNDWIATTIDATSPLRDIPLNIEGTAQEIFEALNQVIRFAFIRNADKVKGQLLAICEEAVRLKLALRQAPDDYKIEIPSQDPKKWGEPGCDQDTKSLKVAKWIHVIDHEVGPEAQGNREGHRAEDTRDEIACIPFGALTKLGEGAGGEKTKIVLERGWVVTKTGDQKLKRGAPAVEEEEQHPRKRIPPNHGIHPLYLAKIKALVGGD